MEYVLQSAAAAVPAELACIFAYSEEFHRLEVAAHYALPAMSEAARRAAYYWIEEQVWRLTPTSSPIILNQPDVGSALVFPLTMTRQVIGLLALFTPVPQAYTQADADQISPLAGLARTILENQRL